MTRTTGLASAIFAAALALGLAGGASADTGRQEFMLSIDHHVSPVTRLAVHEERGVVLTGALDRSARYWSLDDGDAWAVRHPPHGPGRAGQVTAVEMLPSGVALLAAPSADYGADASAIYAVEPKDGRVIFKRDGFPGTVYSLSYRAEGRFLAAALGAQGLVLLDRRLGDVWRIVTPGVRHVWALFGPRGRLVSVTDAGTVAVHEVAAETGAAALVAEIRAEPGAVPASAAISPDGRRIAVGYDTAPHVDVFDLPSGTRLERLTLANVVAGAGALNRVAWAGSDGGEGVLYAGGTVQVQGRNVIGAWRDGRGIGLARQVALDSISHIVGLSDGGAVYASTFPSWGRLAPRPAATDASALTRDVAFDVAFDRVSHKLDHRGAGLDGRLAVSADGRRAWVRPRDPLTGLAGAPVMMDLGLPGLVAPAAHPPAVAPQRSRPAAPGLAIGALPSRAPEIGGKDLATAPGGPALGVGERVLSGDVAQTGAGALLGADHTLYLTDRAGRLVADRPLPAAAWGVALTPAADLAVAALGDGTLRWYAVTWGAPGRAEIRELAAAFIHADRATWVAWRRDGAFAHSAFGGTGLGGYVVNRTRFNAQGQVRDFGGALVTMSEMYNRLYDPAAVARTLASPERWDQIAEGRAVQDLVARAERPVVRPVRLCEGQGAACTELSDTAVAPGAPRRVNWGASAAAALHLEVEGSASGLDRVQVYRNGRFAGLHRIEEVRRRGPEGAETLVVPLALAEGPNAISLRLYDRHDVYSDIAVAEVARPPLPPSPDMHVLGIGVATYRNETLRLLAAAEDASAIAELFDEAASDEHYVDVHTRILRNERATLEGILAALSDLAAVADADDTVIVYMAGHGETGEDGYVFLPHEVRSLEHKYDDGLTGRQILNALGEIRSDSLLVMIDTCYADALDTHLLSQFAHDLQSYFLLASNDQMTAQDRAPDSEHGVFATVVLEGLDGAARLQSGNVVDAVALGLYAMDRPLALMGPERAPEVVFRTGSDRLRSLPLTSL